jgi:2-polyprenyl-6-methoxyphenol hydroxylase-like FAD-dependent oxidoreductase
MKVIVIGAGPAGLITALRLKQANNAQPVIYELRAKPGNIGGAIQLPPNGVRLLDRLGLLPRIQARAFSGSRLMLHSTRSEVLVDLDRAAATRKDVNFEYMRILRGDLMDVLMEAVHEQKITIHFSKQLQSIEETGSDVGVTFADGHHDSGELLLGCDGIHSAVRSLHIDPSVHPEYTGISNMFGLLPTSALEAANFPIEPALHATMTTDGMLGLSPYSREGDHLYWFFSQSVPLPGDHSREGWQATGEREVNRFKDQLLRSLEGATGAWIQTLKDVVQKTDSIKFYPVFKLPAESKWFSDHCLLMGDAAHAMPPHLGQGTSMALEDAFLLSRLLDDKPRPLSDFFSLYQTVRRPRTSEIGKASAGRATGRHTVSPFMQRVRELGIGIGFQLYKAANLQYFGVGTDRDVIMYDIMEVPLPLVP